MSYAYADRTVWLEDLAAEAHPMVHDLCDAHSSGVRVPNGWSLQDHRSDRHAPPGGPARLDLVGA